MSDERRDSREPRERPEAAAPRALRRARPCASLKMQAIGFLSRREYSRQELRTKLLDALRRRAREDAAQAAASDKAAQALVEACDRQPSNGIDDAFSPLVRITGAIGPNRTTSTGSPGRAAGGPTAASGFAAGHQPEAAESDAVDPEAEVDRLLDWLAEHHYLSDARFVESRVNARSRKQGTLRIKLELSRHGLALEPEQAAALRETEFARAQALWQRKFGEPSSDARLRAKQARFLAARGFAADVVRRVVGGEEES